jgi:signal transduction histidine kinase
LAPLRETQDLIQQGLREIRTVSYLLHPPVLDTSGLGDTLTNYLDGVARRGGLTINLKVGKGLDECRPRTEVETALFRIAQEAIGNALRHSKGSRIDVGLNIVAGPNGSEVVLTVCDDGVGPPPDLRRALASPAHCQKGLGVGLAAIQNRLAELGGRLIVERGLYGGMQLMAVVPLRPRPAAPKSVMPSLVRPDLATPGPVMPALGQAIPRARPRDVRAGGETAKIRRQG